MRMLSLLALLLSASVARADVPGLFSVQGVLRDDSGALQTRSVTVSVSLYDAQTGGKLVAGPYGPTTIMASDGLFTLPIDDNLLGSALFASTQLWLQVTVDGTAYPAQQVAPQLMALRAGRADQANALLAYNGQSSLQVGTAGGGTNSICSGTTMTTGSAAPLYFGDYNLQHVWMTLTSLGQLGIGITDPASRFAINDVTDATMAMQSGNHSRFWTVADATLDALLIGGSSGTRPDSSTFPITIRTSGMVGINTNAPGVNLDVNGTVRATTVTQSSDARLKTDVRTLEHALDDLAQLRGVRYRWKRDGRESIGVIAQEVERVFPELVITDAKGIKAVDYGKLTAVLIEGHKALAQSLRQLRDENVELRARLERIERRLASPPAARTAMR